MSKKTQFRHHEKSVHSGRVKRREAYTEMGNHLLRSKRSQDLTHVPDTFCKALGVLDGLKHGQVEGLGSSQNGVIFIPDLHWDTNNTMKNLNGFSKWFAPVVPSNLLSGGMMIHVRFDILVENGYHYSDFVRVCSEEGGKFCDRSDLQLVKSGLENFLKVCGKGIHIGYVNNAGELVPLGNRPFRPWLLTKKIMIVKKIPDTRNYQEFTQCDLLVDETGAFPDIMSYPKPLRGRQGNVVFTKSYLLESIFLVAAYLEAIFNYIPKAKGVRPTKYTLPDLILDTVTWGHNFVKNTKFVTVWPMAKFLKNPLPARPSSLVGSPLYLRGDLKKMLHARLCSSDDKKSASLFFTILQGVKRACYTVDEGFVSGTLISHANTLGNVSNTPHPWTVLPIDRRFTKQGSLANYEAPLPEFEDYCHRLFSRFRLKRDVMSRIVDPSTSSSYVYTRGEGGQRQEVIDAYANTIDYTERFIPLSRDLQVMNENGELHYPKFGIQEYWDRVVEKHTQGPDAHKPVSARVVAVIEPIKVRTITAGQGELYYLSKPLQQDMWSYLFQFPQFSLIGEPLEARHLVDLLGQTRKLGFAFTDWVSGDFAGATDSLDIQFTLAAFDTLMAHGLRTDASYAHYYSAMRKVLEPHYLIYNARQVYPNEDLTVNIKDGNMTYNFKPTAVFQNSWNEVGIDVVRRGVKRTYWRSAQPGTMFSLEGVPDGRHRISSFKVLQRTGQLMGSPLSFPLLCAINLICYWISIERYLNKRIRLQDLPVRINGDDILFASNAEHYDIWKKMISQVGFKLSLGKNYIHPRWLTVNSLLFHYDPTNEHQPFKLVNFTNIGMFMAQSKGSLFNIDKRQSLRELYSKAVFQASDPLDAHKRFLYWNKKQLNKMTLDGKLNLFVPLRYGGLGFPIHDNVASSVKVTRFQQRFGTFLKVRSEITMSNGSFPSKYIFATVSSSIMRNSLEIPAGRVYYSYQPAIGPLPEGVVPLTQCKPLKEHKAVGLDDGEIIPSDDEMVYRQPHKSLFREFNRLTARGRREGVIFKQAASMPVGQLLYPDKTWLCWAKTPDHSLGWDFVEKNYGIHDFGSNQQTAPYVLKSQVQSQS